MTSQDAGTTPPRDERSSAELLRNRLQALADSLQRSGSLNPTGLLCIRNIRLSEQVRLEYRAEWIGQLIERRRPIMAERLVAQIETARVLILARQGGLREPYLARNRQAGAQLAEQLRRRQPGRCRLSHYCSRRTGPDTELLAVEFFARALDWDYIDGAEDYLAAMYCICRQADLRYRLTASAAPQLRAMADAWHQAATRGAAPSAKGD